MFRYDILITARYYAYLEADPPVYFHATATRDELLVDSIMTKKPK